MKPTKRKSWAGSLLMLSDLTLAPQPLHGQTRIAKLKNAYNSLIIGPRGLGCETKLREIMGCKSVDVGQI